MKPKVLIVDDEKLNVLTFEAFLSDQGYELLVADDGATAIELARRVSPDLILLDVMMPEMDGFSVCRQLRADPAIGRVPIIMVTALHDSASRLEGLKAGADDFLTKPCEREEIRARVRTVVSLNRFRAIADERARFESLYRLAPAGIVLTDARSMVVAANPAAEALLGPHGQSLVGGSLPERFGAGAGVVRDLIATLLAGRPIEPTEIREGGKNGRIWRIRGTVVPEGGADRAMLLMGEVTGEVQAREALATLNQQLDALVRARTKQLEDANALLLSYASFVSHDLRSPLTVVKGYLSMIQEGVVPLAEAGRLVAGAYQGTIMMQELVQNILQLAHDEHDGMRSAEAAPVDPRPVVERVWSHVGLIYPHAERTFSVDSLPAIAVNPLLLERVFYNLLTNAAKYSANKDRPTVEVGAETTAEGPALFVRDNGIGFDDREALRLFQEFSRLETAATTTEGFGLGLSLVNRLVRAHGGRMWAQGKRGEGATFYVRFGRSGHAAEVNDAATTGG